MSVLIELMGLQHATHAPYATCHALCTATTFVNYVRTTKITQ